MCPIMSRQLSLMSNTFAQTFLVLCSKSWTYFFSAPTITRIPTIRKRKTFQSPRRKPLLSGKVPLDATFRHYSTLVAEMFFNPSISAAENIDSFAEPLSNNHQTWLNTGEFPVGEKKEIETHSRRRPLQLVWPPAGIDFDFLGPKVHKQQCIDFLPAAFWLNFALQEFLIRSGFASSFFCAAPTLISHQLFSFLMRFFFQFIHRKIRLLLLFLCSDPCRCSLFTTLWRPDDVLVHGTLFNVETKTIPSGGFRLRHNHWKVTKIDPDFRFHPDDADDGGNKTQNPSGSPLDLRWPHFRGLASSLYCAVDAGIGPSAPKRMNLIIITVVIVSGCTSCVSWAQLVHTVLSRAWHSSSTLTGGATLQPFCGWWVAGSSWKSIHTRALVAAHTTTNSL